MYGIYQPSEARLADQIIEAIERKAAKNHAGKDQTIIILDYRSNYPSPKGLAVAREVLADYFELSPFPEILIYVGYFSDDIGNNAEFSIAPLKLGPAREAKLAELIAAKGLDPLGRLIW